MDKGEEKKKKPDQKTIGNGEDCGKLQTVCLALEREPPSSNSLPPGRNAGMLLPCYLSPLREREREREKPEF